MANLAGQGFVSGSQGVVKEHPVVGVQDPKCHVVVEVEADYEDAHRRLQSATRHAIAVS
ncbi:MAG: hypothetical protein ABSF89_17445 [Acidimicrobiales bacterium]|jgi:hypothetical protein